MTGLFETVAPAKEKAVTAEDIREGLRIRYAKPEWAIFFEVANGTGATARRYADAVAMNLFPSRGLAIHGFEIKVSRRDWQHELKQPIKSEAIQAYCDAWWIVTPKDIVKLDELPPTWGLMEFKGGRLHCVVKAPTLAPLTIDRSFAAALIRRAGELDERQRQAALARERADLQKEYDERIDRAKRDYGRNYIELKKEVDAFEAASGIQIRHYGGERIGAAVSELLLGWNKLPARLTGLHGELLQITEKVANAVRDFTSGENA